MNYYLDREGLIELWSRIKSSFTTAEQVQNIMDNANVVYQSNAIPDDRMEEIINGGDLSTVSDTDYLNMKGLAAYDNLIKTYINNSSSNQHEWGSLGQSQEED